MIDRKDPDTSRPGRFALESPPGGSGFGSLESLAGTMRRTPLTMNGAEPPLSGISAARDPARPGRLRIPPPSFRAGRATPSTGRAGVALAWLLLLGPGAVEGQEPAGSGIEPLLRALAGESQEERSAAARALGQSKDPRAVEPMVKALGTSSFGTRKQIVRSLNAMREPLGDLVNRALSGEEDAFDELSASKDRRAFGAFLEALHGSDKRLRLPALRTLGVLADSRAVEPLLAELTSGDPVVRTLAAASLGQIGDPLAIDPLVAALDDSDLEVFRSALLALAGIRDGRVVDPLIAMAGTSDVSLRTAISTALKELGEPVGAWYHQSLDGDREAAQELSRSDDPRAVRMFVRAALDPDRAFRRTSAAVFFSLPPGERLSAALASAAGGWDGETRLGAGRLMMADPLPLHNRFFAHCARVATAPGSLAHGALVLLPVGAGLAWGWRRGRKGLLGWAALALFATVLVDHGWRALLLVPGIVAGDGWHRRIPWVPGWAGWVGLACLLVSSVLYSRFLLSGLGGWILMAVSLSPLWLAALGGLVQGAVRWPAASERLWGLVCPVHFCRFEPRYHAWAHCWSGGSYYHATGWDGDLTAAGSCRVCDRREGRFHGVETIVAVLDNRGGWKERQVGGEMRINWLRHRQPLDLDSVVVLAANDEEVEAFTNQMRFESEERIASRLLTMGCRVDPECGLSDGTMRLLELTFGEVKMAGEGRGRG